MTMVPPTAHHGLVLGKFYPPHAGHGHLVEFARPFVEQLTIAICSLASETIPGTLRRRWLEELYPWARIVHIDDDLPSSPDRHPDFWQLWRDAILAALPDSPELVFASERYGHPLAKVLGAKFIPVDIERSGVPISASAIRRSPSTHWRHLPPCVRAHYAPRICVYGPESAGKTTLCRNLARHFDTTWVPEYARTLLEQRGGEPRFRDMVLIARGQRASEEALVRRCRGVLFMDTDVLSTSIWSHALFGRCDPRVLRLASQRHADLYLLCDIDVPWVDDPVRYLPDQREACFQRFQRALDTRGLNYEIIRGSWSERWHGALTAIRRRWPQLEAPFRERSPAAIVGEASASG